MKKELVLLFLGAFSIAQAATTARGDKTHEEVVDPKRRREIPLVPPLIAVEITDDERCEAVRTASESTEAASADEITSTPETGHLLFAVTNITLNRLKQWSKREPFNASLEHARVLAFLMRYQDAMHSDKDKKQIIRALVKFQQDNPEGFEVLLNAKTSK